MNWPKIIAIVGARNSSINGRLFAGRIAKELIAQDFVVASGLARGIDTAVHHVDVSKTIAVIAGGIDHIYPPENSELFQAIAENGLIIAELPIGAKPLSNHFPQRNRLISGIALAVAVIEAGVKSGSLITANFALEQNREVFAMPGFPLDPRATGTNKLIKNGAYLLESGEDIINNIIPRHTIKKSLAENPVSHHNFASTINSNMLAVTDSERKQVLTMLSASPVSYDSLATQLAMPIPVIYMVCLELELAGKISRHPGNKIALIY